MTEELRSKQIICQECGGEFTWTVGEQRYFADRGYQPPKRCRPCREAAKTRAGERVIGDEIRFKRYGK